MEKEVKLRKAVLKVAEDRADDEEHQARAADEEAHSADERMEHVERDIKVLRRKATYKRCLSHQEGCRSFASTQAKRAKRQMWLLAHGPA